MVRVKCLAGLKRAVGGQREITVSGALTVKEVIDKLRSEYGEEFEKRVVDETGQVKRYIAVHVDGKDIRLLEGLGTKVKEDTEIVLLPMVAGG